MLLEEFPEQAKRMIEHGRRNVSLSTVAPTGSLSMLAQVSSGIEPVFSLFYQRRRKVNPNTKDAVVTFVDDNGDSWEQFNVLHHKFKDWMNLYVNDIVHEVKTIDELSEEELTKYAKMSPYAGATANEIDWEKRVRLQGLIQKYITHSISSTINLPEDVSVEEVERIYMAAWKEGLKGITVYREGSRSGVLINKKEEKAAKTSWSNYC
jgi:ribonucleoside-diphosphate reductase alpha chain